MCSPSRLTAAHCAAPFSHSACQRPWLRGQYGTLSRRSAAAGPPRPIQRAGQCPRQVSFVFSRSFVFPPPVVIGKKKCARFCYNRAHSTSSPTFTGARPRRNIAMFSPLMKNDLVFAGKYPIICGSGAATPGSPRAAWRQRRCSPAPGRDPAVPLSSAGPTGSNRCACPAFYPV